MYLEFFGLREAPFQVTPDSEFLYLSTQHSLAQAYLNYSILHRDSFVVITGEIGSGKTTLLNRLLDEVGERVITLRIFQTQISVVQFLQSMLVQIGVEPYAMGKVEMLTTIDRFLEQSHEQGKQVVLIVDEAQNLNERVLEEIRLLSEVDTPKTKILNVVLVGQPNLREKLDSAALEQLAQRVRYRFHIGALSRVETEEYIEHRLKVAGHSESRIFAPATMPLIYRYTGGIPRLINVLCDTALTGAFAENSQIVTNRIVESAIAELDWAPYEDRRERAMEEMGARIDGCGKLVLSADDEVVREFPIRSTRVLIGRDGDNDVQLLTQYVSRHHAQINVADGVCWLTDLNSTNGTFVNGQRVNKHMLHDGDVVQLGRNRLTYQNPAAPASGTPSAEHLDNWRETTVLEKREAQN